MTPIANVEKCVAHDDTAESQNTFFPPCEGLSFSGLLVAKPVGRVATTTTALSPIVPRSRSRGIAWVEKVC